MQQTEIGLCERLEALSEQSDSPSTKRLIIALAGGPGSGKSTISASLQELYNKRNEKKLKVVPLVCYNHHDNRNIVAPWIITVVWMMLRGVQRF